MSVSTRKRIAAAVIGVGPIWEARYRPLLLSLQERVAIQAVYDPVAVRAKNTASEFGGTACGSLHQLFERSDLQAVLICDAGWVGATPLEDACRRKWPTLLAGCWQQSIGVLQGLHRAHRDHVLIMPELSWRHTPATRRLRELIATRLGPVHSLRACPLVDVLGAARQGDTNPSSTAVPAPCAAGETSASHTSGPAVGRPDAVLRMILDWALWVTGSTPVSVRATVSSAGDASRTGQILIQRKSVLLGQPTIELAVVSPTTSAAVVETLGPLTELTDGTRAPEVCRLPDQLSGEGTPLPYFGDWEIQCERGVAHLRQPNEIHWSAGGPTQVEHLATERSATALVLDLFFRRVVGGLVPVADLSSLLEVEELAHAVGRSLAESNGFVTVRHD